MPFAYNRIVSHVIPMDKPDDWASYLMGKADIDTGWSYSWAGYKWAGWIHGFAKNVIPISNPLISEAAYLALIGYLSVGFATVGFTTAMRTGLTLYSTALGLGMLPLFIGIPPIVPLFPQAAIALGMSSPHIPSAVVKSAHYAAIALYFQTGFAINTATGVPVKWM